MDRTAATLGEDRKLMLFEHVLSAARREPQWSDALTEHLDNDNVDIGIHLAIFVEPYLRFILDRTKTIESRFSRNGCAPFERVSRGDVLLLKRSSGPIVGLCTVSEVWDYRLTPGTLSDIRDRFGTAICPQKGFWEDRREAAFATLIGVDDAQTLPELTIPKKDRRGWVVLKDLRVPELL